MLSAENLTVRSGDFVLQDVTLSLERGQCGVVVGPSGAGKSTLLETIAGLRKPERGRITLNGREITNLPPERRGIAFVPQDYALFPHLTAKSNILLAPKLLKMPKDKLSERFDFLCELLELKDLLDRRPRQLSGGERQRVALARALMLDPQLLLLDEPFAALDPQMRPSVRRSIGQIFRTLKTTVLIVTHDLWDAAALGDKVFVLEKGRIIQSGSWSEVIADPKSDFITDFVGINRLTGKVVWREGKSFLQVQGNLLPIQTDMPDGTFASLKFFPSQIELAPNKSPLAWQGRVDEVMNLGDRAQLVVAVSDKLVVRIETPLTCRYEIGDEIAFTVKSYLSPVEGGHKESET
ncbi:MAG: ABC transporter ATP-binding protein [Armatimonadetes bacterium]|nr:ABC transporter ATP-binding protein [Armatimonadota bacterium]MCX7969056.1 ABC transporter ATP-binding protein [Armatimonadota bacterium]MDW8143859.1 ABC transporter ATP-binding protein [Armatimonadota bacterium]